jgi:hypothetical protein
MIKRKQKGKKYKKLAKPNLKVRTILLHRRFSPVIVAFANSQALAFKSF